MIDVIFYFGTEIVLVRVNGRDVTFGNSGYGMQMAPLSGLRLDYSGAIKEFPDLKDNPLWREEVIKRFKAKINAMQTEKEVMEYVITDLKKYGYIPKFRQVAGHRREVL